MFTNFAFCSIEDLFTLKNQPLREGLKCFGIQIIQRQLRYRIEKQYFQGMHH
jgi:hypothetical protein